MIKSFLPRASLDLALDLPVGKKRVSGRERAGRGEKNKTLDSYQFKWCVLLGDGRGSRIVDHCLGNSTCDKARMGWRFVCAVLWKKTERAFCLSIDVRASKAAG